MATKYTITGPAYIKLFFHLAKHPHQRVNGVLIGKELSEGVVEATDAIPLLHHWTSLSPMMEIGLDLVRFPKTENCGLTERCHATGRTIRRIRRTQSRRLLSGVRAARGYDFIPSGREDCIQN